MVVDRVANTSTSTLHGPNGNVDALVAGATTYQPTSSNVFSMPADSPASNSALFGITGGSLEVLDGLTGAAAQGALAFSAATAPYSAAATLYGPNVGFSAAGILGTGEGFSYTQGSLGASGTAGSIGLAGDDADALKYAWDAQKRLTTDVRGGFDQQGSSTAGHAQYNLGRSWLADVPKLPVNLALNAFEGGVSLLSGALPGTPDYVPFLEGAKIPYNSEASSYAEFGVGLLLGGRGVGAAREPSTITVFRVEGEGNRRLFIDEATGSVSIPPVFANKGRGDERNLYLNFGDEARAQSFLGQRLQQFPDNTIKTFTVPKSFVDQLRTSAVEESRRSINPGKPVVADPTKARDQFGLSQQQIEQLRRVIIPGSGKQYGQ
ncbi:hypothetical protein [Paraburkholderia metrosideri]|uniref:Peptidase S74 domain-containing protein n=1 Tax=Paraburkholderia metrosideri TaxID=580937 RepID=A0ABM8NY51_9BURK|nr:hypothetical protein [Paraburkholderia metrosideri]CAD6548933.1 hypothetical protein LMG28140_04683 [Paraburkholderia metrosideri]